MRDVRAEASAWFADAWNPDLTLAEWWAALARSGWGFPTFPSDWFGRGLTRAEAAIVDEERRRAGAARPPMTLGAKAIAPLLIAHGTDAQRREHLLPTISGNVTWCELFSEPDAGSDLAGLRTVAERDGDEWNVNGQKVWSSGATIAEWGLLVARTDPHVAKRAGLTCFILDMHAPGVDARPLRAMTGDHKFSEVFLTDVRVPAARVLADLGRGWELTTATLKLERTVIGPGGDGGGMADNHKRPPLDRPAGEVAAVERAGQQRGAMVTGAGGMALIRTLLERFGGGDEPVVRQDVARLYTLLEVVRWTGRRGADASTLKLLTGRGTIALRDLALRLEGPHGGLSGEDAALGGVVQKLALTSPSMSIMAGTDEIQRNLIGERVLGLPREP